MSGPDPAGQAAIRPNPGEQRASIRASWERAAAGWERQAQTVREWGMPVSQWMIERISPRSGQRVLELAAGPGDTGFLAAEMIGPDGRLICTDGSEAMVEVARTRARQLGIDNVEFRPSELEWIDAPTGDVDAILCRWGLMFAVDPEAALRECRRVLRPGGAIALAVWDEPEVNPWATIPTRALIELGHAEPPDRSAPGMFALASAGRLRELLTDTGFTEPQLDTVDVLRERDSVVKLVEELKDCSMAFAQAWEPLSEPARAAVGKRIEELSRPYTGRDGSLRLPGRSLVATAAA